MSVERIKRKSGAAAYRVRWRQGTRNRARAFDRRRDAEAFQADVKRRQQLGELAALDGGSQTLAEFAEGWFAVHAQRLAPRTARSYAGAWDRHIGPALGDLPLRELDVQAVEAFDADLASAGLAPASRRRVLTILSAAMQAAARYGVIPANPVRAARKPTLRPERAIRPLAPERVERMRRYLLDADRHGDAALVALLAYSGMRPGEASALRWGDVRERSLLVERSVDDLGELRSTKTGKVRSVRLLGPLRADLLDWRMRSGNPDGAAFVFPNVHGGVWTREHWGNFRRRRFHPAAEAAGVPEAQPYDLRHSFASLMLHEGRSVIEVAAELGHAPTLTLGTYGHVMAELDGAQRTSAEATIKAARESVFAADVRDMYATAADARS